MSDEELNNLKFYDYKSEMVDELEAILKDSDITKKEIRYSQIHRFFSAPALFRLIKAIITKTQENLVPATSRLHPIP